VACIEEKNTHTVLLGKSKGKKYLGRPRSRWEDNTCTHVQQTEWNTLEWGHLAQVR
jgi:hypothetical protein